MSTLTIRPEDQMAALFKGLLRYEQMALLGRLENAGGQVYRALAAEEKNAKAKEVLLKAAEDEERNGGMLALMTTPKSACEKCGRALPAATEGQSCSFQCTFCDSCATTLQSVCPNCGGALESRQRLAPRLA